MLFEFDARISGPGECVQDERDEADDESAPESGPETRDFKVRAQESADEIEKQRVYDQQKETKAQNKQWQCKTDEYRFDKRVQYPQQQGGDNEIEWFLIVKTFDEVNGNQHG